jgi:hypothetical protein
VVGDNYSSRTQNLYLRATESEGRRYEGRRDEVECVFVVSIDRSHLPSNVSGHSNEPSLPTSSMEEGVGASAIHFTAVRIASLSIELITAAWQSHPSDLGKTLSAHSSA